MRSRSRSRSSGLVEDWPITGVGTPELGASPADGRRDGSRLPGIHVGYRDPNEVLQGPLEWPVSPWAMAGREKLGVLSFFSFFSGTPLSSLKCCGH